MENPSQFSLSDYKQIIFSLSSWLRQLRGHAEKLSLSKVVATLDDMLQRVETNAFSIAIVGEFKRGKSTLINALLGKEILPSDILPTTATVNRITYGIRGQVRILFKDDSTDDIELDQLEQYVTKLTPEAEAVAATVREAVVYYPVPYCQNNVDIIDTPGLSDETRMTETTLAVLPQVDAAIFVIMAQAPFSESERAFLENDLLTEAVGRILFVVTGIDRCNRPEDVDRILQSVRERIKTHVLKGAEERFGAGSEEYHDYLSRIGNPRVFGVSAYQALQAKISGDMALLAESRFQSLETALEKFLTEERGVVFLQVPVNRILSVARKLLHAVDTQQTTLRQTRVVLHNQYEQEMATLTAEQQQQQSLQRQYEEVIAALKKQFQQQLHHIGSDLQAVACHLLETTLLNPDDFNQNSVIERMDALDLAMADTLEKQCRRWAGKLQADVKSGTQGLSIEKQPSTDQINQLLNQIGLHGVNLGAALKQRIQQNRAAWQVATDATGGIGGWLNQNLRSQDLVTTFKSAYQNRVVELIQRQIAATGIGQTLHHQLLGLFNMVETAPPTDADFLQTTLSEQRLHLEREDLKIEFQIKDLQTMQLSIQQVLEQTHVLSDQLLEMMPEVGTVSELPETHSAMNGQHPKGEQNLQV